MINFFFSKSFHFYQIPDGWIRIVLILLGMLRDQKTFSISVFFCYLMATDHYDQMYNQNSTRNFRQLSPNFTDNRCLSQLERIISYNNIPWRGETLGSYSLGGGRGGWLLADLYHVGHICHTQWELFHQPVCFNLCPVCPSPVVWPLVWPLIDLTDPSSSAYSQPHPCFHCSPVR